MWFDKILFDFKKCKFFIHTSNFLGPQTWKKHFTDAKGQHQSPINIDTSQALFEPSLLKNPFTIQYDDQSCIQIKNTGFTFQVDGYQENLSSKILKYNFVISKNKNQIIS